MKNFPFLRNALRPVADPDGVDAGSEFLSLFVAVYFLYLFHPSPPPFDLGMIKPCKVVEGQKGGRSSLSVHLLQCGIRSDAYHDGLDNQGKKLKEEQKSSTRYDSESLSREHDGSVIGQLVNR